MLKTALSASLVTFFRVSKARLVGIKSPCTVDAAVTAAANHFKLKFLSKTHLESFPLIKIEISGSPSMLASQLGYFGLGLVSCL